MELKARAPLKVMMVVIVVLAMIPAAVGLTAVAYVRARRASQMVESTQD